jgi:uroporphyrinogen-III synthase
VTPDGSAGPTRQLSRPAAAAPGRAAPLAGLTVLVPRARDQAGGFSELLAARGAEALEVPMIEIRPVAATGELDRAVGELAAGRFDWLVLTSVNGVAALRGRAEALGHDPAALGLSRGRDHTAETPVDAGSPGRDHAAETPVDAGSPGRDHAAETPVDAGSPGREGSPGPGEALAGFHRARTVGVAAVGPATAAALRDWGVEPDLVPEVATTAAVGRAFPAGRGTVLLARADLANPELAAAIAAKGWRTREVVAYRTVPVEALDPAARRRLDGGQVDWVAFTAASTVTGFLRGYGGPPPPGVRVAAIGPVTAGAARSGGMRVAATAAEHTIAGLVEAIERAVAE